MKVSLLQVGARHGYALPRFLYGADMLQRFYSDFTFGADSPFLGALNWLPSSTVAAKLRRRVIADVPGRLIDNAFERGRDNRIGSPPHWKMRPKDLARSDIFYAHYFSGLNGLKPKLAPHQRIVSDVITVPSTHHIVNAEAERFPDWAEPTFDAVESAAYDLFTQHMLDESDALFCPATSVIDDIAKLGEQYRAKCWLVPYGASLRPIGTVTPTPKRVLFAGSLTLRKGIQYIRAAADRIARIDPAVRFVIAGGGNDIAAERLKAPNIDLLGHLSRDAMAREFAMADIFLFPTLAEGSAGVALEAMAAGLPLVTTRSAGLDLTHADSAIFVPEREVDPIVEAVLRIVNDRELRASMSRAAVLEAETYNFTRWSDTFLTSLKAVGAGASASIASAAA